MDKSLLWYLAQFGMFLEAVGALWMVCSAYKGMKDQEEAEVKYVHADLNEYTNRRDPQEIISSAFDVIASTFAENSKKQFRNELYGFAALAVGFILQFIGSF